ncbi:MAG: hypothetical protein IH958_05865 [Chloroflexi bacterium]|nr:hypothetical protein [Chloroflexota bacterium]
MARGGFAFLMSGALAAGSLALLARRRRRARRNPSGLAEADLSADERREAAEKLSESWADRSEVEAQS